MTSFHEGVRTILAEVEKCFLETMKKEKLGKSSQEHRQKILDMIQRFRDDYPQMGLPDQKSESDLDKIGRRPLSLIRPKSWMQKVRRSVSFFDLDKLRSERDESSIGGSSGKDEDAYSNYSDTVPDMAAADLPDKASKYGFMEKKQKKGLIGPAKLQKRWCAIYSNTLYYYEKEKDKKQRGAIKLPGYKFRNAPDMIKDSSKKDLCFELVLEGSKTGRTFQFVAASKEDLREWQTAIEYATGDIHAGEDINDGEDLYEELGNPFQPGQDELYEDTAMDNDDNQSVPPSPFRSGSDEKDLADTPPPVPPFRSTNVQDGSLPDLPPKMPDRPDGPPPLPVSEPPKKLTRSEKPLPAVPSPSLSQKSDSITTKTPVKHTPVVKPEEDFENMYYGMWDCMADCDKELAFKRGDIIHVINKDFDDRQWWIGELQDKTGLVPKTFLTAAYELVCA